MFEKVLKLVEKGYTIEKACKNLGIGRPYFYKNISDEQKIVLKTAKTANAKVSVNGSVSGNSPYIKHYIEPNFNHINNEDYV